MNFKGKTVVLRAIERADLELLAQFHNDPQVGKMIEFSWPIAQPQQERFFRRNLGDQRSRRLIVDVPGEGVVGYTGLWGIDWIDRRATNGIIIGRSDLRRRGLATDAILTLLRVAFDDLGLHRVDADIFEFNRASLHLYIDKCGFREEGRRREHVFRDGRFWDRILVGITSGEYQDWVQKLGYGVDR